jgi:hypothetical protein
MDLEYGLDPETPFESVANTILGTGATLDDMNGGNAVSHNA